MRRSPGHYASLFRPAEQFFDLPLTAEPVHNPASTPQVLICTQHPPPKPRLLQLAAQRRIHMPAEGRILALSANFELYADMSERMASLIAGFGTAQEIYSIDESFVELTGVRDCLTKTIFQRIPVE